MSFMKEILVANIAFAAYLVISADGISIEIIGCPFNTKGLYNFFNTSSARCEATPITILSGFKKSSTAAPSFKNSGLEATSNSKFAFLS